MKKLQPEFEKKRNLFFCKELCVKGKQLRMDVINQMDKLQLKFHNFDKKRYISFAKFNDSTVTLSLIILV